MTEGAKSVPSNPPICRAHGTAKTWSVASTAWTCGLCEIFVAVHHTVAEDDPTVPVYPPTPEKKDEETVR